MQCNCKSSLKKTTHVNARGIATPAVGTTVTMDMIVLEAAAKRRRSQTIKTKAVVLFLRATTTTRAARLE